MIIYILLSIVCIVLFILLLTKKATQSECNSKFPVTQSECSSKFPITQSECSSKFPIKQSECNSKFPCTGKWTIKNDMKIENNYGTAYEVGNMTIEDMLFIAKDYNYDTISSIEGSSTMYACRSKDPKCILTDSNGYTAYKLNK